MAEYVKTDAAGTEEYFRRKQKEADEQARSMSELLPSDWQMISHPDRNEFQIAAPAGEWKATGPQGKESVFYPSGGTEVVESFGGVGDKGRDMQLEMELAAGQKSTADLPPHMTEIPFEQQQDQEREALGMALMARINQAGSGKIGATYGEGRLGLLNSKTGREIRMFDLKNPEDLAQAQREADFLGGEEMGPESTAQIVRDRDSFPPRRGRRRRRGR